MKRYFPMHDGAFTQKESDMNPVLSQSAALFSDEFLKRRQDLEDEIDDVTVTMWPDDAVMRLGMALDIIEDAQELIDAGEEASAEEAVATAIQKQIQ